VAGGGAIPWSSRREVAGIELTDVGRTRSGGSGHQARAEEDHRGRRSCGRQRRDTPAGRRRTDTGCDRVAVQAGGRALLMGRTEEA
jgi:hypothetical protein